MSIFKTTRLLALAALASFPLSGVAGDDFGLWTEISAEKKLTQQFSIDAGIDFRAEQQLKSISRWAGSLGFAYKPTKFLKASVGYAYIYDRNPQESKKNYGNNSGRFNGYNVDHGFWRSKHRFYADLTGKLAIGRLTLSLRERYQMTHSLATSCKRTRFRDLAQGGYTGEVYPWDGYKFMTCEVVENDKKAKTAHYLRSRIEADYNISHCPLTPYVSFEWSNNLSNDLVLDKTRLTVGGDWKLSKKHKISAAYIYQDGADDDGNDDIHVISVGYKFTF